MLYDCCWTQICLPYRFLCWQTCRALQCSWHSDVVLQRPGHTFGICCEIAMLLVWEQSCWHCKLVNSRNHNPCIYQDGDIVFAQRATHSNAKRGRIDKLKHPFTGPWQNVKSSPGALYKIECCRRPIILRTVQGYFWRARQRSDAIPVMRPDR
jgi:hypothetical protein